MTPTGVYTAPSVPGVYHLVATSRDSAKSAQAAITVVASNPRVFVSPSKATLAPDGQMCFRALVLDSSDARVSWSAPDGGTVDAKGCFHASSQTGSYRVTATSAATAAAAGSATVNVVTAAAALRFDPGPHFGILRAGGDSIYLYARAPVECYQDSVNLRVDEGAAGGTLDLWGDYSFGWFGETCTWSAHYTTPASGGLFHATAALQSDPRVALSWPMLVGMTNTFAPLSSLVPVTSSRVTKLADGRVLVSGGSYAPGGLLVPFEATLFDPRTNRSVFVLLQTPRRGHTATLLDDGRVLLTGGVDTNQQKLASAEVFDPVTGTTTTVGTMNAPRRRHWAVKLGNGKVLVGSGGSVTAELFDPVTNTFELLNDAITNHEYKAAALMDDGRVLLMGGYSSASSQLTGEVHVYDPATRRFSLRTTCMAKELHQIVPLGNQRYLLTPSHTAAEIYDDATGRCTTVDAIPPITHSAAAVKLRDGRVALIGGHYGDMLGGDTNDSASAAVELFDPVNNTCQQVASLALARFFDNEDTFDGAVLLDDGRVLVSGGTTRRIPEGSMPSEWFIDTAELWLP